MFGWDLVVRCQWWFIHKMAFYFYGFEISLFCSVFAKLHSSCDLNLKYIAINFLCHTRESARFTPGSMIRDHSWWGLRTVCGAGYGSRLALCKASTLSAVLSLHPCSNYLIIHRKCGNYHPHLEKVLKLS